VHEELPGCARKSLCAIRRSDQIRLTDGCRAVLELSTLLSVECTTEQFLTVILTCMFLYMGTKRFKIRRHFRLPNGNGTRRFHQQRFNCPDVL
jgi:hypothetical protein